jgi:glutathione S-transferase
MKLYGIPGSRATRNIWAFEETGLPYERINVVMRKETGTPEFLAVNPNGRIPVLVDGDFVLFESLAINTYIAKKAGGDLAPKDLGEDATNDQWSLWVVTETEKAILRALSHTLGAMGYEKDPAIVAECMEELARPFKVLDGHLVNRDYLMGGRFTIADLNVASVLAWATTARLDLSAYPNMDKWLKACLARDGYHKVRAIQKAG